MEAQVKKIDFTDQNIYVGFDAHLKSWEVTVMVEDTIYKTFTRPPRPEVLYKYHSAYEAGFCGYWIHDKLVSQKPFVCLVENENYKNQLMK